jgi:hypothetical protein
MAIEGGSAGVVGTGLGEAAIEPNVIVRVAASAQKAPVPQTIVRIIRRPVASANPPRRVD